MIDKVLEELKMLYLEQLRIQEAINAKRLELDKLLKIKNDLLK